MRTRRGRPSRGFTLIEVLVVIAIIALLVSILLPAIAAARNPGRKIESLRTDRCTFVFDDMKPPGGG